MITLYKPEDETEAIAITALLEENSIHSSMQSFHDTAYDGLFQGQHGWGVIKVNESDFDTAAELLKKWDNGTPVTSEVGGVTDPSQPNEQANYPSQKRLSMPLLLSLSVVINVLLAVLYFSPKWKQAADYEIFDADGKKSGLVEWKDNELSPYKYIAYLQNGTVSSVSIDNKDSGRPDRLVLHHPTANSTYQDNDGDGIFEYLEIDHDSGSKSKSWDADQNGIFEKTTIRTANGKNYIITSNNQNGFDLTIKTPSGDELSFDAFKVIAGEI